MRPMKPMSDDERRARLGVRHHLARTARAPDVTTVAEDLVGLHSSDPAAVFLSAAARVKEPAAAVAALEAAMYDDHTLVRTLGMRRTMFVVPRDLVPIIKAACTDALVPAERKKLERMIVENHIATDGARWLRAVEDETLAALESGGDATGAELSKLVPGLRERLVVGEGKTWGGTVGMTTRVLFLLATEQRVVRGRPDGSWASSRYRWSPMATWLPEKALHVPPERARTELLRRWLGTFGPATTTDVKWWTGWSLTQTKAALQAVHAVEVMLEDATGWVLPGDERPTRPPKPWVALLPGLDPTTMGWKQRDWYLGHHGPAIFDRNGNAGPTVWVDGRIVGGWAQRRSGEVVHELLDDVGADAAATVQQTAADLESWLGDIRVTPRFPTPLQQALAR